MNIIPSTIVPNKVHPRDDRACATAPREPVAGIKREKTTRELIGGDGYKMSGTRRRSLMRARGEKVLIDRDAPWAGKLERKLSECSMRQLGRRAEQYRKRASKAFHLLEKTSVDSPFRKPLAASLRNNAAAEKLAKDEIGRRVKFKPNADLALAA